MFQLSKPKTFAISSKASLCVVSTALFLRASRSECAMTFASRKSRMRAPLHRRTEEIGACLADPFANGEGGKRRYVHHPKRAQAAGVSTQRNFAGRAARRQPGCAAPHRLHHRRANAPTP